MSFFCSIAILGRRDDESTLIKEESVVMDPVPLEFDPVSSIQASHTNITMRATKPERALQVHIYFFIQCIINGNIDF